MNKETHSYLVNLIIETTREVGYYDLGQIMGLLQMHQISTDQIKHLLEELKSEIQSNLLTFPTTISNAA